VDVLLIRFPVALQKFPQGGGVFMPHVFSSSYRSLRLL
jgi:hypothetical protein